MHLIRALLDQGHKVSIVAPRDEYTIRLEQAGCTFTPIRINNQGTNPVTETLTVWSYLRIYSRLKPEIILHFTPKPNIYGSMAAGMLKIPCINNISGLGTAFIREGLLGRVVRILYRLSQRSADKVFFQNKDDLDMFVASGLVKAHKAGLLPGSGVDVEKFNLRLRDLGIQRLRDWGIEGLGDLGIEELRDSGIEEGRCCNQSSIDIYQPSNEGQDFQYGPRESNPGTGVVFLLIARLIWDKGIREYAEAARIIKTGYPEAEFRLLGFVDENNPGAVPEETIREWEEEGILKWLGRQDDVRPYIAAADCVVLPSYYREGTPRTLLEAAAMGKPLIAADTVGTREPVQDGVTGYLCRPRDAGDLAGQMERMINIGHEKRLEMGQRGREKMEREYDENIVINKYMQVIQEIL